MRKNYTSIVGSLLLLLVGGCATKYEVEYIEPLYELIPLNEDTISSYATYYHKGPSRLFDRIYARIENAKTQTVLQEDKNSGKGIIRNLDTGKTILVGGSEFCGYAFVREDKSVVCDGLSYYLFEDFVKNQE